MAKGGRGWSQTWKTFLRNHAGAIGAMDFAVVPAVDCRPCASVPEIDAYAGSLIDGDQFPVRLQIFPVNFARIPCSFSWVFGHKGSNLRCLLRLGMVLAPVFFGNSQLIRC